MLLINPGTSSSKMQFVIVQVQKRCCFMSFNFVNIGLYEIYLALKFFQSMISSVYD